MGKKSKQKGNAKVIVPVVVGTLLLLIGVPTYFMLFRNSRSLSKATMSSNDNKANQSISPSTNETSKFINCGSIKVPLPEEWQNLKNADISESSKMKFDVNGCSYDEVGCLCLKKSPHEDKNIIISILTTPTLGKDLVDCTNEVSKKNFLEISASALGKEKKDDEQIKKEYPTILGEQGIKKTVTSSEIRHSSLLFIKDCKLYSFDLSSGKEKHDILWTQIENNISRVRF